MVYVSNELVFVLKKLIVWACSKCFRITALNNNFATNRRVNKILKVVNCVNIEGHETKSYFASVLGWWGNLDIVTFSAAAHTTKNGNNSSCSGLLR